MAQTGNSETPICCGEPMLRHKDPRCTTTGFFYQCRVDERARNRKRYAATNGLTYNRILFMHRRNKAMTRRRNREAA